VDVLYFDFSKAFDRVPGRRLLHKLDHFGIRGPLLRWIAAFLTDRRMSVRVGLSHSQERVVSSGVPQGSVLGPILFLIYVSDLPCYLRSNHAFYADDTKIFGNPLTHHDVLQRDICSLERWCAEWLIPLNPSKCSVLHIGRNNPHRDYRIGVGQTLMHVDRQLDLGVLVNSTLSWSDHIASVVKRANSVHYLMNRAFQRPHKGLFNRLYTSYIRPLLEYAVVVWSPYLQRDIALLERVQRRATRGVVGLSGLSYPDRLSELGLLPLVERRERGDLIQTFRILRDGFSLDMRPMFALNIDERLRGHQMKLSREKFGTSVRQHFLTNRVFHRWNSLPDAVVGAPSMSSFKTRLDQHLESH
jgi:hypothetical protein